MRMTEPVEIPNLFVNRELVLDAHLIVTFAGCKILLLDIWLVPVYVLCFFYDCRLLWGFFLFDQNNVKPIDLGLQGFVDFKGFLHFRVQFFYYGFIFTFDGFYLFLVFGHSALNGLIQLFYMAFLVFYLLRQLF